MSDEEVDYLKNYRPDHLYVHPGRTGKYAKLLAEGEELIAELEVSERFRIAVTAFHVDDRDDYGSFYLTKIKLHAKHGWRKDGEIKLNNFGVQRMRDFVSLLSVLELGEAGKARISLDDTKLASIETLLRSDKAAELLTQLSQSDALRKDVYAMAVKRGALIEFEQGIKDGWSEPEWQAFFERNRWIFGLGLQYVFLDAVGPKLEATTTGHSFNRAGKRADGLLRTRAEISQYVLIEIKRADTDLLRHDKPYRPGCWSPSDELSSAVTQVQKTAFDFCRGRFRDLQTDEFGNEVGGSVYAVEPRSFLVVGSLAELRGNDDKIACFELFRKNIRSPEILTFDELLQRATCMVENLALGGG